MESKSCIFYISSYSEIENCIDELTRLHDNIDIVNIKIHKDIGVNKMTTIITFKNYCNI